MSVDILIGDCRETLRGLPGQSVHCCVTSPPYFGLRDYESDGQFGLEATPAEYVAGMVDLFREVRRVLRDDGTFWLNIGDSYWTAKGASAGTDPKQPARRGWAPPQDRPAPKGLKGKDLIGILWMLAFALRDDGWYLRQEIIWHKPNAMPESVRDRCTRDYESIFMLSKKPRYFFDIDAIKEPAVSDHPSGNGFKRGARKSYQNGDGTPRGNEEQWTGVGGLRNRRSVWSVNTKPFKEAHFATFPPELIDPCILAGCPKEGTVLDPFGGSGTTGGVAAKHGRNAILCELNPGYVGMMHARITSIAGAGWEYV